MPNAKLIDHYQQKLSQLIHHNPDLTAEQLIVPLQSEVRQQYQKDFEQLLNISWLTPCQPFPAEMLWLEADLTLSEHLIQLNEWLKQYPCSENSHFFAALVAWCEICWPTIHQLPIFPSLLQLRKYIIPTVLARQQPASGAVNTLTELLNDAKAVARPNSLHLWAYLSLPVDEIPVEKLLQQLHQLSTADYEEMVNFFVQLPLLPTHINTLLDYALDVFRDFSLGRISSNWPLLQQLPIPAEYEEKIKDAICQHWNFKFFSAETAAVLNRLPNAQTTINTLIKQALRDIYLPLPLCSNAANQLVHLPIPETLIPTVKQAFLLTLENFSFCVFEPVIRHLRQWSLEPTEAEQIITFLLAQFNKDDMGFKGRYTALLSHTPTQYQARVKADVLNAIEQATLTNETFNSIQKLVELLITLGLTPPEQNRLYDFLFLKELPLNERKPRYIACTHLPKLVRSPEEQANLIALFTNEIDINQPEHIVSSAVVGLSQLPHSVLPCDTIIEKLLAYFSNQLKKNQLLNLTLIEELSFFPLSKPQQESAITCLLSYSGTSTIAFIHTIPHLHRFALQPSDIQTIITQIADFKELFQINEWSTIITYSNPYFAKFPQYLTALLLTLLDRCLQSNVPIDRESFATLANSIHPSPTYNMVIAVHIQQWLHQHPNIPHLLKAQLQILYERYRIAATQSAQLAIKVEMDVAKSLPASVQKQIYDFAHANMHRQRMRK